MAHHTKFLTVPGSVVRRLLGYRRFQGIAAAQAITRLYGASRLFVNFFQPSFKLMEKHRQGAHVTKRYHPPQTPSDRLLQAESLPEAAKAKLREVAGALDPLKLLEEIRAVQAHLVILADGGQLPGTIAEPPDLSKFIASLSSAWRAGEVRPTFSVDGKPQYVRGLQTIVRSEVAKVPDKIAAPITPAPPPRNYPPAAIKKITERPQLIYAEPRKPVYHAFTMIWPLVCRRLEGFPNMTVTQLFEELCIQFPGRFRPKQVIRLGKRVKQWRQDASARGVVIPPTKYRSYGNKPRGRGTAPHSCTAHWTEMLQWLEEHPDETAVELLSEFQARYPGTYHRSHLRTLRRRVQMWRREAIQRLIYKLQEDSEDVSSSLGTISSSAIASTVSALGNISREATGNKIT